MASRCVGCQNRDAAIADLTKEVERLRGVVTDKNHEWAEDQKELWRLRQQIERHESAIASYRADRDTAERKLARLTVCPEEENGRHRWDETGQCWCCEQRAHILIYEATGEGK